MGEPQEAGVKGVCVEGEARCESEGSNERPEDWSHLGGEGQTKGERLVRTRDTETEQG